MNQAFVIMLALALSSASASLAAEHEESVVTAAEIKAMREPLELLAAGSFKDGGTIYVQFRDRDGRELSACTNGILRRGDWIEKYSAFLYLGARHPTDTLAVAVDACGDAVRAIHAKILPWISAHPESTVSVPYKDGEYSLTRAHRFARALERRIAQCDSVAAGR